MNESLKIMHVVNPLSTSFHVFFLGGERLMYDMYLVMHASEATVPFKKLTHQETVSYDNISNYDISIQIVCQLVHSMDMMWKAPQRFLCNLLILESNNQVRIFYFCWTVVMNIYNKNVLTC